MYYVFGSDGSKTGPFSKDDIAKFVSDKRLNGASPLEHADTGEKLTVGDLMPSVPPKIEHQERAVFQHVPDYSAPQPQKKNQTLTIVLILLAVVLGACGTFAAILYPVFNQAKKAARKTQTLVNVKNIATAMMIYQADYDDHFPTEMGNVSGLQLQMAPYLRSDAYFSFEGHLVESNPKLAGTNAMKLTDPSNVLMLWLKSPRVTGKKVVATADSATYWSDETATDLIISSGTYTAPPR